MAMTAPRSRRLAAPVALLALLAVAAPAPAQLTWNLTYQDTGSGVGFDAPGGLGATRQATVAAVTNYLSTQLDARGTINLRIQPSNTQNGFGFLAQAGTSFTAQNGFANGLVFQRATTNNTPFSPPDGSGQFNFASDINWNNGTGQPAFTQFDLFSVTLHEFTHALGFAARIQQTGQGASSNPLGQPDNYSGFDRFLKRGSTNTFLVTSSAAFNSAGGASATDLTSNDLFFDGPIARAANGGNPVKLFAPNPYQNGSSVSHLDNNTPALSNGVMLPGITNGTTRRQYTNQDLAMLIDVGWNNYTWTNTTGNWADNISSTTTPRWRNVDGDDMLSPVGSITPNLILRFGGSGATGYTSTNNLPANPFQVNRTILNSSSTATNTIAGNQLQFGTTIGVQPQFQQTGSGAFNITTPISLTAAGLELTGDGGGLVTLGGAISGNGLLTKTGASTFVLAGANTYTANTTVSAGTLRLGSTGSFAASPRVTVGTAAGSPAVLDVSGVGGGFAVANGQTLAGHGSVTGSVRLGTGATVSPGTSPGTLAVNGTVTLGPGGTYTWELNSVTTSSTTQDRLTVNGPLDISGLSPTSQFRILLTSLTSGNTPGAVSDFSNSTNYQWPLVTYVTLVGTFDSNAFTVDRTNFANAVPVGSLFSVGQAGNVLVLNYSPVPEPGFVLLACAAAGLVWRRFRLLSPLPAVRERGRG
jgi:autotransporter-associated beta strand protein